MISNTGFLLLDSAQLYSEMENAFHLNPNNFSLYRGESEEALKDIAPYLFSLEANTLFVDWFFENGWGKSWGVLVSSSASMEELHKHFRKFLFVQSYDGSEMYFRFYDPRVLRIFLPTCDKDQLLEFFGPIKYFLMEDEESDFAIQFSLQDTELISKRIINKEIHDAIFEKSAL